MRRRDSKAAVYIVLMCLLGGVWNCSKSATTQLVRDSPFTKPEDLAKLTEKPAATGVLRDEGRTVERWEMQENLPTQVGLIGRQGAMNAFDSVLLDVVSQSSNKKIRSTEGMHCAASEMGRFALQHDLEYPSESLREFIRHRCGVVAGQLWMSNVSWDLEPGRTMTEADVPTQTFDNLRDSLKDAWKKVGPMEAGIWFGQVEGKAVIQIVAGPRRVNVETFDMVPKGDVLIVEGELLRRADGLGALITSGRYDAENCVMDSRVTLPKFRATCPVSAADERAVFELYNQRDDSIFSEQIFSQSVWPAKGPVNVYSEGHVSQMLASVDTTGLSKEEVYLKYINTVRADAGLEPVSLNGPQSLSTQALAPYLFEARKADDTKTSNEIVMGLIAGWEIDEDIIDADFQLRTCSDGSIMSLVESSLASPGGRKTLLARDGDTFALGEVREGDNLGAFMVIYEFLPDETYIRRIARAWRTVNKARKLSGRKPIKRSKKLLTRSEDISKKMSTGVMGYDRGVESLQQDVMVAYNDGVYTFTVFTHDLDDFALPKELLEARSAEAVLMVAPMSVPDYPWTIYAVVMTLPAKRYKK